MAKVARRGRASDVRRAAARVASWRVTLYREIYKNPTESDPLSGVGVASGAASRLEYVSCRRISLLPRLPFRNHANRISL